MSAIRYAISTFIVTPFIIAAITLVACIGALLWPVLPFFAYWGRRKELKAAGEAPAA